MLDTINVPVIKITTEMLRKYLAEYQAINNCGKVTIDNIRRSLGSVVILKNNAPRYLVIDFSKADDSAVAKDEDVLAK